MGDLYGLLSDTQRWHNYSIFYTIAIVGMRVYESLYECLSSSRIEDICMIPDVRYCIDRPVIRRIYREVDRAKYLIGFGGFEFLRASPP